VTEQAPAADPVTAAIAATVGNGIDEATAERIARLARYLLDGDPALSMRLGPYKLDAPRAAVKAAVTAAALAIAIEGAGLDSVPVVVLACVVPFLVEIERVELTPGDDLIVAALRATAPPGGDDHDWVVAGLFGCDHLAGGLPTMRALGLALVAPAHADLRGCAGRPVRLCSARRVHRARAPHGDAGRTRHAAAPPSHVMKSDSTRDRISAIVNTTRRRNTLRPS